MKLLSFDIESCTGSHNDASLCSFGYVTADEFLNIKEQVSAERIIAINIGCQQRSFKLVFRWNSVLG